MVATAATVRVATAARATDAIRSAPRPLLSERAGRRRLRPTGHNGAVSTDDPTGDWTTAPRGQPHGGDLTGRLLLATPALDGGIFARSVILVLHHDPAEGAQGVVLDRPTEAPVERVLPGWGEVVSGDPVLFQGGPVGEDSALGVVSVPGVDPEPLGVRHLFASIGLVDLDTPPPLVVPHLAGLRIFAGYAGWSAGQLEAEIGTHSWYVVDSEPGDVFTDRPQELWRAVLRRQPGRLAWAARFPADAELN